MTDYVCLNLSVLMDTLGSFTSLCKLLSVKLVFIQIFGPLVQEKLYLSWPNLTYPVGAKREYLQLTGVNVFQDTVI